MRVLLGVGVVYSLPGEDVGEFALRGEGVDLALPDTDLEVLTEKLEVWDIARVREREGLGE